MNKNIENEKDRIIGNMYFTSKRALSSFLKLFKIEALSIMQKSGALKIETGKLFKKQKCWRLNFSNFDGHDDTNIYMKQFTYGSGDLEDLLSGLNHNYPWEKFKMEGCFGGIFIDYKNSNNMTAYGSLHSFDFRPGSMLAIACSGKYFYSKIGDKELIYLINHSIESGEVGEASLYFNVLIEAIKHSKDLTDLETSSSKNFENDGTVFLADFL